MNHGRILIVDDDPAQRRLLRNVLSTQGYWIQEAVDGQEALDTIAVSPPDLILMDLDMPRLDGFAACARLKSDPQTRLIPVVIVTSLEALPDRIRALELGVDDFLNKPVILAELGTRVRALLKLKEYTDELEHAGDVLAGIARVVENRDAYTGHHGCRVAKAALRVGRELGLRDEDLKALRLGALFHDLGKIAVPDAVLRKPGPLTSEEYSVMKSHPGVGADLCRPLRTMKQIIPIIRHHHEKLDGSGYPDGLRGDEIPLIVRIVSVVDVYDALTTDRPYRAAYSAAEALRLLMSEVERGWWDADVVGCWARLLGSPTEERPALITQGGMP
jgi:putative two-component system response regulator